MISGGVVCLQRFAFGFVQSIILLKELLKNVAKLIKV